MVDLVENPDFILGKGGWTTWNLADRRRHSFHNLHLIARNGQSFRAPRIWPLVKDHVPDIAERPDVQSLTSVPAFSAMVVLRGNRVLYERYAPDFGPDRPHSIMSITKTMMNLVIGRLVAQGLVDLSARIDRYLPWIGPGYAGASLQEVLNMDVANAYSEDYSDPTSTVFAHEVAMGLRLAPQGEETPTTRSFLADIGLLPGAADTANPTGRCLYKSANTDVLGLVAEQVSGRPMRAFLTEIAEAAGIEGALHVTLDSAGFPAMNGGVCVTARDLARYGMIFAREGIGVDGRHVGDKAFLQATRAGGIPMPPPRERLRYSNQTNTDGDWIGHGGYGGQYMLVNPTTQTVCVYFSVVESESGYDLGLYPRIIRMQEAISRLS